MNRVIRMLDGRNSPEHLINPDQQLFTLPLQ